MGEAIGQILPLAVGVALSPIPIIAVVLMLVSERARANGPAFVVGWLVGLAIIGAIVLAVSAGGDASEDDGPATWVSILTLVLGVLVLRIAARQWRGRPHEGDEPKTRKWMQTIDSFTPVKSLGVAVLLAGINPKNLLLAIAAGAAIAQTGISTGEQIGAYAVFALVGTMGGGVPVVLSIALGDRSRTLLDRLSGWMGRNSAAIMAVLCLVIGAKLIGDGISGLA